MLYLDLKKEDFANTNNAVNLVVSQYMRRSNLFFNLRIFSSMNFVIENAELKYKFKRELIVEQEKGGGTPNSPFFFKNPQFCITVDKSKILNPAAVKDLSFLARYQTTDATEVKMFLAKLPPEGRIN